MEIMRPLIEGQHVPQCRIGFRHENLGIIARSADRAWYLARILPRIDISPVENIVVLIHQLDRIDYVIENIGWPARQHHPVRCVAVVVLRDILLHVLATLGRVGGEIVHAQVGGGLKE